MKLCGCSPVVKDKGYAWFVLVMSFLTHVMHLGFGYAVVGNLTIAHEKLFNVNLQKSALIGSAHIGFFCLFGPIASVAVKKFGCGWTQIFGGICLLLGVGLSALSTQFWQGFLLFSVLTGIGAEAAFTASSQILAKYFEKYKFFAFSFAMSGFYVGMIMWPIISQKLLDRFGYSKAMAIMSIPQIIQIFAGVSYLEPDSILPCCSSTAEQQIGKFCKDENSSKGLDNMGLEASKHDLTAEGADEAPEVFKGEERVPSLKTEFGSVLKSYKVWLLMINAFLWNANVAGFLALINDYVINRIGINEDEAALGITILGAANLLGCLAVIGTSSLNFDRLILHITSAMLFAICTLMIAFTNGKVMYYALTAGCGLGQGVLFGNLLATITTFGTDNQFFVLLGLQLLGAGIGALAVSPITGYIASNTTDQYGMIFTGCCGVLCAISLLPVLVSNFRTRRKAEVANRDRQFITASRKTGII